MQENIECEGFTFFNNFDSANLAKVEKVEVKVDNGKASKSNSLTELPHSEFNLWTKHDCHGTEFENNNRTWFYFGIKSSIPGINVKLNLVNLNRQLKMFSQGMTPVYKVIPGHPQWERIKEKPTFMGDDKSNEFVLSFTYRTSDNCSAITYFAFTYPFSYTDLQNYLRKVDTKMMKRIGTFSDDVYYHRECAIKSLEGRRLDILTISSYYNVLQEREAKIKGLYPEKHERRAFKFKNKKVIFLSARVHPGETPSSFVLNGFLNFILNREDPLCILLRRLYVFKLIPMLNPDGVSRGYYRMDTKGVNLNRLYLNPSKSDHPTIFAAKTLLRYYHNFYNLPHDEVQNKNNIPTIDNTSCIDINLKESPQIVKKENAKSFEENEKCLEEEANIQNSNSTSEKIILKSEETSENEPKSVENQANVQSVKLNPTDTIKHVTLNPEDSGIFLYIDFHGHATKKGIFMYGNHFEDPEKASACMLLPKLMSLNNANFHFTSCSFAEKNMYLVDKRDGMSREGSGRVAVHKLTGLIYSYTLECNYNTGRLINTVPPRIKEGLHKFPNQIFVPPKYSPSVFEEIGAALGPSILDMTGNNPNSRLPNSHYRSLKALQAYLKLISATNFQTTLNKPLNKNNGHSLFDFSQGSTSDEIIKLTKTKKLFPNNSRDVFRTTNVKGTIRKIKNGRKQVTNRNIKKFSVGKKSSNRETKVIVSKIISTNVQPNCRLLNSTHKRIKANSKSNSTKNKLNIKEKKIEQKSCPKKSTVCAKRTVIKKQGTKKLKTIALSKVRHQFKIELGESSLKKVTKFLISSSNEKKNNNFTTKKKTDADKT